MPASWSGLSPLTLMLARARSRATPPPGNDAFFNGSAGSVQCIFDAGFLFFHFDFGGCANLDHGNAAGQLGHALLQFFAVVVGGRFFDLDADLLDAALRSLQPGRRRR